jgi:tetratricopeptide (TPR) repeat protein
MMTLPMLGLLAGIAVSAQEPAGMPEAWKQKTEAADKAMRSGDRARAEALLVEVVCEAEKFGAEDLRLARPLEELGTFYVYRPVKRFAEADSLLRRALAIREKTQGPDHPDLAVPLSWLAVCRMCAGGKDAVTAGPLLQRALAIREKKNKDDPEIASTLDTLAMWHMILKEYDQAESKLMRALAIREKVAGPPNADLADVLDDLGNIHLFQSDPYAAKARSKSEPNAAKVPTKPDPNVPPDLQPIRPFPPVPDIAAPVDVRTEGELKAERHAEQAEQFYKRALAIREKVLRPDHPDIAATLLKLGQLASICNRPADGAPYLARWLALEEKAKAPPSKDQAQAGFVLAEASRERKDWAEAERRLAKTQAIIESLPGTTKDQVASILVVRADVAIDAGRFDDAEAFVKRGLEICTVLIGPADRDIVRARELMAGSYRDHVNDRRAPRLWERVKALGNKTIEEHDHGTLWVILNSYDDLLRRSNRVLPRPTQEDLAYLKKARILFDDIGLESLLSFGDFLDPKLDDAGLAHFARLYDLQRLSLRGITDAGLAHIKDLVNLRDLSLAGAGITDAGLKHLEGLESLERLDIEGTKVTRAGVERLRRARPELNIDYRPGPDNAPSPVRTSPAPSALAPP